MKTLVSLICLATCLTGALSSKEWPIALDMACHKALSVVACSFEFTNVADEDLYILTSDSPLEGLFSPFIAVFHEGQRLQYKGLIGFRVPPRKQDFLLIKAGQSVSATVQLSDVFTFSTDGLYNIRYAKPLKFITRDEMELLTATGKTKRVNQFKFSKSINIYLEDTHLLMRPFVPSPAKPDYTVNIESCNAANYVGGTVAQRTANTGAHQRLCNGFQGARGRVGNNSDTETWFGSYTAARATTARTHLQQCENGIRNNAVTYDYTNGIPTCNARGWLAYTSFGTTTVFLCGPNGYDNTDQFCSNARNSKERILAHEWSHAFGGSDDHNYGPADCQASARNDPNEALDNADNYALFYCNGLL